MSGGVFVTDLRVRFADVDNAGIVYYPRFFHFFHVAMEELFEREFGKNYPDVIGVDHVGFPAVHTEADYRMPVRYGDRPHIRVSCVRIGGKSVTLRYRVTRPADGAEFAEGRITTACVDMRTFTPMEVPPAYREFFSRFLES
ncbi:MAG: acyl-CoA thioesterase [Planctomycetes bacterium]|nr:acyl-CoA thioesterase [Planctomycetota bacterium]